MAFATMMGILLDGLIYTFQIFLITLVGSLPLGVLVALGRMSKFKPLSWLMQFYISIMRGTPLMPEGKRAASSSWPATTAWGGCWAIPMKAVSTRLTCRPT